MADNTIIQQGRFISNGESKMLAIRSGFDWIRVYNLTAAGQNAADLGYEYYFQRGMANGRGMVWTKLGTEANDPITVGAIAVDGGFFMVDSTDQSPQTAIAIAGGTDAVQPVYTTANTSSLTTGSIVRFSSLAGQDQLGGIDFEVDTVVFNTSFRMRWALDSAPGAAATAGFYRIIPFQPIYYPRRRYIAAITNAAQAVVTLTVTHGYTVGQSVRFIVPDEFEMTQMDKLKGTITAVNTANNTITVDIDSTGFTAFDIPEAGEVPFTWAQVVPIGMDTAQALDSSVDILADATINTGYIGVGLVGGAVNPGGDVGDEMYWVAGTSFSVNNQ